MSSTNGHSRPKKCIKRTKNGNRCKAWALHGQDTCLAHADEKTRDQASFGGAHGGRPRLPRPTEVARRLVEENIVAVQRPYWRVLGFDVEIGPDGPQLVKLDDGGAKLHGESKEGVIKMSDYEDLGSMMQAAEKLQDRVFGRPRQMTELSGPEGGPIQTVEVPSDAEWHEQVAGILERAGALNGNGHRDG